MVDDANDQNDITLDRVEYAMPTMDETANTFPQFWLGRTSLRPFRKNVECMIEAQKIGIRNIGAELFQAVVTNFGQICPSGKARNDSSHDGPDVPP